MKLGDRICLLNDGRVEQIDTPEGFQEHPKINLFESLWAITCIKISIIQNLRLNLTRTLTEYDENKDTQL